MSGGAVLSVGDRIAITELIATHGHLVDSGRLDRGPDAIGDAGLAMGEQNPVGHHVTNTVITEDDGVVRVLSKAIGIMADGSCGSLTYEDVVVRTDAGWRIAHRRITPHRGPLGRT